MLYTSLVAERIGFRRWFLTLTAGSLAVNLLLAGALVVRVPDARTIIIPPSVADEREAWTFDAEGPSPAYLERFALSLLSHAANVTPETVDSSRTALLRHTDPSVYAAMEAAFRIEGERLRKDHASTVFYPDVARADVRTLTVEVTGTQKLLVGTAVTSTREKTWRMTFRYDAGRLFLTGMTDRPVAADSRD